MPTNTPSLLEFPTAFPIKIMGLAEPGFAQSIIDIVLRHAPDYDPNTLEMRPSKQAKYLGLTCVIQANSQTQLDALYRELTAHPLVKMVL